MGWCTIPSVTGKRVAMTYPVALKDSCLQVTLPILIQRPEPARGHISLQGRRRSVPQHVPRRWGWSVSVISAAALTVWPLGDQWVTPGGGEAVPSAQDQACEQSGHGQWSRNAEAEGQALPKRHQDLSRHEGSRRAVLRQSASGIFLAFGASLPRPPTNSERESGRSPEPGCSGVVRVTTSAPPSPGSR